MKKTKKKKKRNNTKFDPEKFELIAELLGSKSEIASLLNLTPTTLASKVKDHYGQSIKDVLKNFGSSYKLQLRKLLKRQAKGIERYKYIRGKKGEKEKVITGWVLHPSSRIQMFLAKNLLGYSDNPTLNQDIEDSLIKFADLLKNNYSRRKKQPKIDINNKK